ncbi:MAG: hypothetical protein ABIY46_01840 [Gemmatimonadales bacterium]
MLGCDCTGPSDQSELITRDDRYAFITNFGSGTLSSYGVGSDGILTLVDAVAAR